MIYAFTGKKQSGKSTACSYLATKMPTVRINFKDGLLRELRAKMPDVLREMVNIQERIDYNGMKPWTVDRLFNEKPPIMRALLQNYGTNVRREDNPNYWIEAWEASVDSYPDMNILVDDVRFLNEAEAVRKRGGKIIRIERTDLPATDQHISELEMDAIAPDDTISVKTGEHQKLYEYLDFIITPVTQTNQYDYTSTTRTNVTG